MKEEYTISVVYDDEADVYIATSENIPGLVIEEDTMDKTLEKLEELVPYLLDKNLDVKEYSYKVGPVMPLQV